MIENSVIYSISPSPANGTLEGCTWGQTWPCKQKCLCLLLMEALNFTAIRLSSQVFPCLSKFRNPDVMDISHEPHRLVTSKK